MSAYFTHSCISERERESALKQMLYDDSVPACVWYGVRLVRASFFRWSRREAGKDYRMKQVNAERGKRVQKGRERKQGIRIPPTCSTSRSYTRSEHVRQAEEATDGQRVDKKRTRYQVRSLLNRGDVRKAVATVEAYVLATGKRAGEVVVYKMLMKECSKRADVASAKRFVACLREDEHTAAMYTMLLQVCAKRGSVADAEHAIKQMKERGVQSDCPLYTTLISVYSKAGQVTGAFEAFERMIEHEGIEPNAFTYATLLECLSRSIRLATESGLHQAEHVKRLLQWCESVWQSMNDRGIKADATATVCFISSYARGARIFPEYLETAFAWYSTLPMDERPHHAVSVLLHGCVAARQPERALVGYLSERSLIHARGEEIPPHVVSAALAACVRLRREEEGLAIFREVGHDDPQLIAIALDVFDSAERAEIARQQLESEGFTSANSAEAFGEVVSAFAWEGNFQGALGMVEESKGLTGRVSTSAINAMLAIRGEEYGSYTLGEAAKEEIQNKVATPNRMTWILLIDRACDEGDASEAMHCFERALAVGIGAQAVATPRLMTMLARYGYSEELERVTTALQQAGMEGSSLLWNAKLGLAVATDDCDTLDVAFERRSELDPAGRLIVMGGLAKQQRAYDMLQITQDALEAGDSFGASHANIAAYAVLLLTTQPGLSQEERKSWREDAERMFYTMSEKCGSWMDLDTLDKFMCCFRRPGAFGVFGHPDHSKMDEPEVSCFYYPQALRMYEHAQQIGLVPQFQVVGGTDLRVDLRNFAPSAADVSILTMISSLRKRKAATGAHSPRIEIQTLDRRQQSHLSKLAKTKRASKARRQLLTGSRIGDLLKRLQVSYGAYAGKGVYTITGQELDNYFAGRPTFSPLSQRRQGPDPLSSRSGDLAFSRSQIRMESYREE